MRIAILFLALLTSGCANFWLLYPGRAEENDPHLDPQASGVAYQTIAVANTEGNRLVGWLFASRGERGTVLVAGGNAQNISSTYATSQYLVGNGFRVLIFTYQGFDQNGGHAELRSLIGDAQAFYLYAQQHYPHQPIAFVGYSLGSVTGICLGDSETLSAIVAEGTFNPKTIVSDKNLWIAMPFSSMFQAEVPDQLDTSRCLQDLKSVPVMFLHNAQDPLAPYEAARRLYEGYPGPKEFVVTKPEPGADAHYGSVSDPGARGNVLTFLKAHLAT
jgi:hypothetical protein